MGSVSQWKAWLLAGTTLVAGLGLAVVLYTGQRGSEPVTEAPPVAPAPADSPSASAPVSMPEPEPEAPAPVAPSFDVVRVAEDGGALVAGSAMAGGAVILRVDGVVVAETSADNAGQFVSLFTLPPRDAVQVMTLEMALADGRVILSEDRVILAPRPEAVAALIGAAPASVALAALPPELSASHDDSAASPMQAAIPQGQVPGHEAALSALEQVQAPADEQAGLPAGGVGLSPAAPEATGESDLAESAAAPGTESSAGAGAGATTESTGGRAARISAGGNMEAAIATGAAERGTEAGAEAATEITLEIAAETPEEVPVQERAESTGVAPQTPPTMVAVPDAPQTPVSVPGQTPEPTQAPADEATPRPALPAEGQGPGHLAAAGALEGGADTGIADQDAPLSLGDAPAPPPQETPATGAIAPASEAAEPLLPRAFVLRGSGAVELLDGAPQLMDNVVIDMISYSDAGDVQISGRAASREAGTRVQIYLDNRPIALALAEEGDWASDLPEVDPGIYALRVDQLDSEGRVVSRFETPFQREDPALVRTARAQGAEVETGGAGLIDRSEAVADGAVQGGTANVEGTIGAVRQAADSEAGSVRGAGDRTVAEASSESAAGVSAGTTAQATAAAIPAEAAATEAGVSASEATDSVATARGLSADAPGDRAQPEGQQPVALITVQPGQSLWRISQGHYGAGERYVVIYTANRSQIRNPDLIYPGQIFVLPE